MSRFTIHRLKKNAKNPQDADIFCMAFVGFSDDDKLEPRRAMEASRAAFMWWDYGVSPGDVVQYSGGAVVGKDKDHLHFRRRR